ncbi:MAG: type VI secretion system contractile sheath large subunit [Deltaproteobacteria bacterium]|nr:type VI secretion system contractile sheath large subunit [Deltaproteobacteria bacterium]
MEYPSFPFSILVIAPFTGRDAGRWTQGPVSVSAENLDQVIADCSLSIDIAVPTEVSTGGTLTFPLGGRKDFHPGNLLLSNGYLKNIFAARQFVLEAPSKGLGHTEILERIREWENLPPLRIPDAGQKADREGRNTIDEILNMVALPEEQAGHPGQRTGLVDQMDAALSHILELLFRDEEFQGLERTWAGLAFLLTRAGKGISRGDISVKILPSSQQALEETLNGMLLDMVREIPSLIVVDLPFDSSSHGIALLRKLAEVAETLLVPVLGWVGPEFFHIGTWDDLETLPYLPHHFERPEFAKWQKLRESTGGRWVGLTCNRFLERFPYGSEYQKGPVSFHEPVVPWRSPVWGVAALMCGSQMEIGWPSRFSEWKRFNLEDLALQDRGAKRYYATEAAFDENRIDQMIASGLIPLISFQNKDMAFVVGDPAISGGSLAFQLVLSRIVQFVLWCKENFGKDLSAADLKEKLESALSRFWEKTGHLPPEDMHISVERPDPVGPASVGMVIRPDPAVLPSREAIEFQFNW